MSETDGTRDLERPAACPYCKTVNDLVFTYCRNCLNELPSNPNGVVDEDVLR